VLINTPLHVAVLLSIQQTVGASKTFRDDHAKFLTLSQKIIQCVPSITVGGWELLEVRIGIERFKKWLGPKVGIKKFGLRLV